jgi:D-glycero-alpha-D-manno-heptose-7-phosphate kinase
MKEALLRGEVSGFGELLGEAWREKQRMSGRISTPLIDEAVDVALSAGALGAKVTGAGGGGHMALVCEFERKHLVAEALIGLGMTVSEFTFSRQGVTTWRVPT